MTKKKISKLFDNKVFWAVVSLLAALFIWVYITGTQEEPIEKSFSNVEVVFTGEDTLQASRGYVINKHQRRDGFRQDQRHAPEHRLAHGLGHQGHHRRFADKPDGHDNPVLHGLTYPDGVDADAVSVVSSNPSVISFNVTRMSTKQVPVDVQFRGSTAEGYIAGEVEYEPKTITISGPESELEQIDHVYAEIGGDELTMTRTADVPFVLIDKSGNEVSSEGFEFDITTINVTIPISMVKEVTLYVQCIYGAGATEENTSITIEPSTITISGDTSVVSSLNSINIATIDLTDFAVTLQDTYAITLPNGVENTSGVTKADVTIEIQGVSTKQVTVTNFNYTGLPDGYYVEDIITKNLEVRIRGAQDVLDQIQSSNLRAVADLSDITQTGDMYVPVKVELDGFTDAGAVGEYMIAISIRR